MIIDMHAHLACLTEGYRSVDGEMEIEFRRRKDIVTCFSAGTPQEWKVMQPFRSRKEILVSFGIHPWYADRYTLAECREYLEACDFIGEIGMDSVWCDVPLDRQQKLLEEQLQIGADLKRPALLHTKGQEERIVELIRGFPENVCVHWYSGPERAFEKFLEQDCYFTLGPDTAWEHGTDHRMAQMIAREVPPDRLFLETDGISAVAWAMGGEYTDIREIPKVLERNLEYTAQVKGLRPEELALQMKENLQKFLKLLPPEKITLDKGVLHCFPGSVPAAF